MKGSDVARIYRIGSFYNGDYPVVVTIDGDQYESDENGVFVDPPQHVAQMLEGMPEWGRIEGDHPFGPNAVVTGVLKQQVVAQPQDT